jgi:hypothetical protein
MMPSTRPIWSVNILSIRVLVEVLVADMVALSLIVWWIFRRANGTFVSELCLYNMAN